MSVAVVANLVQRLGAEEQTIARRVAGVLVRAGADLLAATSEKRHWEIGLPGRRYPGTSGFPVRRAVLNGALRSMAPEACQCAPEGVVSASAAVEDEWLSAAGGSSPELLRELGTVAYEHIVVVGLSELTVQAALAHDGRLTVLPLDFPRLRSTPRVQAVLARAMTVLAVREGEVQDLQERGVREVANVGMALRATSSIGPPDRRSRPYVLATAEFSDPVRGQALRRRAAHVARRLGGIVDVVVLTDEFIYERQWPPELEVHGGGSRRDLWHWMTHAVAVVDLQPWRHLAADVGEALLCGAPVIVPVGSAAADHVDVCGGGLVYRRVDDIATMVAAIADPVTATGLVAQSVARATSHFAVELFEERVLAATT